METVEEKRVLSLLQSAALDLGMPLFEWSVTEGLLRVPSTSAIYDTGDPLKLMLNLYEMDLQGIFYLKDFSRFTSDPSIARKLREISQKFSGRRSTIVMTGASVDLPKEIEHAVVRYELQLPGPEELRKVLETVLGSLSGAGKVQIVLRPADLDKLVEALSGMTLNQARQTVVYAALRKGKLSAEAVGEVLERKAQVIRESGLLEYYPVEDNQFQLGGFERLKSWLDRASSGFTPEARELNLPSPRGILLVGVQGCGKSLAAKVTARQWRLPLLKLDAGQLYDKFIGQSEKNLRKAIMLAESMAPTVLWLDEIEKAMSAKGSDVDGGVGRRLFGTFLTWLQEKEESVFVVATANDLSQLPPELLRKGRFDEIFFVDLPGEREREEILGIHLTLRKQDPEGFDLAALVQATEAFSGAEIEQSVISALYRGLHLKQELDTSLLLKEISETVPLSVSRAEDIQQLREMARGRFVPVS